MTALDHAREILPLWVVWGPAVACFAASLLLGLLPGALILRVVMRPPPATAELHWTELARRAWSARLRGISVVMTITVLFGALAFVFVNELAGLSRLVMLVGTVVVVFTGLLWAHIRQVRRWRVEDTPRWTRRRRIGGTLTTGVGLLPHLWLLLIGMAVLPLSPTPLGVTLLVVFGLLFVGAALGMGTDVLLLLGVARRIDPSADTKLARAVRSASERTGVSPSSVLEVASARVNAFAFLLQRRVCVTDGLVEAMSERELAAILAHELGHLAESRSVAVARSLAVGALFLFLVAKVLFDPFGLVPLAIALVIVLVAFRLLRGVGRRMEERADHVAHSHEDEPGLYARALETIYRLNLMPAVMKSRRRAHPHLYDRLLAAGVEPDFPRPEPPARARLVSRWTGSLVIFVVMFGATFGHGMLESSWLPPNGTEHRALLRLALTTNIAVDLADLGRIRQRAHRLEDAATFYAAAAQLEPAVADYPRQEAIALADEGQCDRAREVGSRVPAGRGRVQLRDSLRFHLRVCRARNPSRAPH